MIRSLRTSSLDGEASQASRTGNNHLKYSEEAKWALEILASLACAEGTWSRVDAGLLILT